MSDEGTAQPTATFDAMFVSEYPKMVALAAAVSGSRLRAEDVAQEAMIKLHHNWDRLSAYDRPALWLRRVTINLALSWRRRVAAEGRAVLRLDRNEVSMPPALEQDQELWQEVSQLPKIQRTVLALRYLECLGLDEIADLLDIAPSTARVHLHRAKATLRQRVAIHETPKGTSL